MTEHLTTRRNLFGGAIAIPAALALSSPSGAAARSSSDEQLVQLGARWRDLASQVDRLNAAATEAEAEARAAVGPAPEAACVQAADLQKLGHTSQSIGQVYSYSARDFMRARIDFFSGSHGAHPYLIRAREVVDAYDHWDTARSQAFETATKAVFAQVRTIDEKLIVTEEAIRAAPAATLKGLAVKAAVAARYIDPPGEDSEADASLRDLMNAILAMEAA